MRRFFIALCLAVLVLPLVGCLKSKATYTLKKDGSGTISSSSLGMNRALAPFQNPLSTKFSNHQIRQRSSVRPSIPSSCLNRSTRFGFSPCIMALTSTTTTPAYTLRPRKRTLGGVFRFRHPTFAQLKLRRFFQPGPPSGCRL